MSDLEGRLRAEVTRRTDEFSPSPDLPEHIHKRVGKRRRQRQLQTVALSIAVVAVAVPALLLVRPSDESGTQVTAPDEFPNNTTTESSPTTTSEDTPTTSAPETTEDEAPETTESAPEPPPSNTTETAPPETTVTPTTRPPDLKPPDSDTPTAGVCGQVGGPVVEMTINVDVPDPRCMEVTPGQRLQVRNNTDEQVTVSFADFSATLAPGQSQQFNQPFGDYLQPGVHKVNASPYSGGEINLRA